MLRSVLLTLFLFNLTLLVGQNQYKVFGTIQDEAKEPLPFCNVVLKLDDQIVLGALTDLDGKFVLAPVEPGNYKLEVSYVGYETLTKKVKVQNHDVAIDLGLIEMYSQIELLKPIIYLYPESTTEVAVKLDYAGKLLYTYPEYPAAGWEVTAHPDGTLFNEENKEYYALFWEGVPFEELHIGDEGFVVKGEETVAFLEEALETLGLNRREAMEFIIFWQPRMQSNPYNLIHFSTTEYEALAKLHITPTPETILRVMMVFQPLSHPIDIKPQDLSSLQKERKGFTVVEWGGTELSPVICRE